MIQSYGISRTGFLYAGEGRLKIAFQGCRGAFSHKAVQLFAHDVELDSAEAVSCESFSEVFDRLLKGECDFGVLPLENSSVGSIVANYDLLWRQPVVMVGEVYLPVHHNLLGFPGTDPKSITEIYSHPVALEQCRKLLASLPNARAVSFWDTGGSAFHVQETGNPHFAAIASELAAQETGLAILEKNIEDHGGNNTRFGVITVLQERKGSARGSVQRKLAGALTAPYKISCAVELAHEPGSLAALLTRLSLIGVNLTKIESRPIPETPWHYRFFLDIEISHTEQCDPVIEEIESQTQNHKIFGRYNSWHQRHKQ